MDVTDHQEYAEFLEKYYERIIVEQPDRISEIPIASLFHRKRTISLCVVPSRTYKWPTEFCDVILHLQYASFVEWSILGFF
jgi:hypothetical protein